MVAVAVSTRSGLARRTRGPGRIGGIGLGVEVLLGLCVTAAVLVRVATPIASRCEPGPSVSELVVGLSAVLEPVIGGIVLALLIADARQRGGVHAWHLAVGALAVVTPLAVLVEVVIFGLICSGR